MFLVILYVPLRVFVRIGINEWISHSILWSPCRYSIDRHTDLERLFNIDSVNGTITTLKALDREMSKWHNISVVATEISTLASIDRNWLLIKMDILTLIASSFVLDNPRQTTRVPVFIKVLDVNDNAPEFAMSYDTFVCENVKAGQVTEIHGLQQESKNQWLSYNN